MLVSYLFVMRNVVSETRVGRVSVLCWGVSAIFFSYVVVVASCHGLLATHHCQQLRR
jgi:hypothetical protein